MSKPKIGELYHEQEELGRRDAFHVPAILVTSATTVLPGSWVRFTSTKEVRPSVREKSHGMADPFVGGRIAVGVGFWVLLNPSIVMDLTHSFVVDGLDEGQYEAEADDSCAGCYGDEEEAEDGCAGCYGES